MTDPVFLCRLDQIDDPGSRGFEDIDGKEPFFVVRQGDAVFAYRNFCPHYGAPLDWKPHAFLSYHKDQILCSMHGALFNVDDGVCIDGPCPGKALTSIKVTVRDRGIYLADEG